jgi:hypothetical protein
MIPTVSEQLQAMRRQLTGVIIPALDPEAEFARQQALLISATLEWLCEVHSYEYRYEVVENLRYRELLEALTDGASDDEAAALLTRPGPHPSEAATALSELVDQTKGLKERVAAIYQNGIPDDRRARAKEIISAAAREQVERELSWYRLTGFPGDVPPISEALSTGTGADHRGS